MKATLRTARCFLVDLEPGDIVKTRNRYAEVHEIVTPKGKKDRIQINVRLSDGIEMPVYEGWWFEPVTVYYRKATE